jgi:hypothetical protein
MPSIAGLPGGALPFSGPLDLASINAEWGLGTDLTLYHNARWYYDGNLTTGLFNGSTIKISDFYGKRATDPAGSGVYFANTAGSSSFTVPLYRNSIKIEIWGGGGAGGNGNGGTGTDGGDSNVLGVTAGGGKAGSAGNIPVPAPQLDVQSSGNGGRDSVSGGYYGPGGGYYGNDGQQHNDANQVGPNYGGTYGHI